MTLITKIRKAAATGQGIAEARWRGLGQSADKPVYLDIGARGGLPPRWQWVQQAGLIRPAFVEAEPEEAERLQARLPGVLVLPHALGDVDGEEVTLHVTREPGRSSVLEPDMEALRPFGAEPWDVVRRVPVTLRRLDQVWPADWPVPTMVKVDVQGFELRVLEGFGELLDEVSCVELETVISPLYRGQPTLAEMTAFMRSRGFGLVRLASMGLFGGLELIEFNAFWVRKDRHDSDAVQLWRDINTVGDQRRIVDWGH
ncbi:MAG: FkbM family methyltransferase [Betaproteobacteria bacterium]